MRHWTIFVGQGVNRELVSVFLVPAPTSPEGDRRRSLAARKRFAEELRTAFHSLR